MKKRVTVTRTVIVEVDDATSKEIAHGVFAACNANPGIDLDVKIETLLVQPERRVVMHADDWGSCGPLDADFENEEDRAECEELCRIHGVWGFVCEQRDVENGAWEHVDSCWGFIGNDDGIDCMREHMPDEFKNLEMIDEHEAKRMDEER